MKVIKQEDIQCVKHGATIKANNFYLCADKSIYSGIGRVPICKTCLYEAIEDYYNKEHNLKLALYNTCRLMDLAYDTNAYDGTYKLGMTPTEMLQAYLRFMNSIGVKNGQRLPFELGEHITNKVSSKGTSGEKGEKIITTPELEMTEEDLRIKSEVLSLMDYDPFLGYSESDQKKLYQDLIGYLEDEEIVEDNFLLSVIVNIVITNLQIRKVNFALSQYMQDYKAMLDNQSEIRSLTNTKEKLMKTINDTAKENNITVKSRGGNAGKNSLTAMTARLQDLGFERVYEDYYDQLTARSMERVANISMKAMSEQLKLDENDVAEIMEEQRLLIKDLREELDKITEERRKLTATNKSLELEIKRLGGNIG